MPSAAGGPADRRTASSRVGHSAYRFFFFLAARRSARRSRRDRRSAVDGRGVGRMGAGTGAMRRRRRPAGCQADGDVAAGAGGPAAGRTPVGRSRWRDGPLGAARRLPLRTGRRRGAVGRSISGKWQATWWPGAMSRSGGSCSAQTVLGVGAPGAEPAARRRVEGRRQLAGQGLVVAAPGRGRARGSRPAGPRCRGGPAAR